MSKPAAIKAEFTDYRPIKTRKVLQLVFEVPAEQQAEIFEVLGYPIMGSSTWCGIARLVAGAGAPTVPEKAVEPAKVEKTETKRSSRAYLMCKDYDFVTWMLPGQSFSSVADAWDKADRALKDRLGIKSKSELDTDPEAAARFDALRTDFELRDLVR